MATTIKKSVYIKSPLNYTGGKYKLLNQILPMFPKEINKFVDLFCGGSNVGVNVNANQIICNDNINYLINLFNEFQELPLEQTISHIENRIVEYNLSKENQEGYLALREFYNKERIVLDLYVLVCYSFNHVIRFNKKHEFNTPFGKNRSHFSPSLKQKLIDFIKAIKDKNILFTNEDFEISLMNFNQDDFFYCDPPYLISQGVYNDGKRGFEGWSTEHETRLLAFLDNLNRRNIKFALSNVFENKGLRNEVLIEWCEANNFFVTPINSSYGNSNYQRKDRDASLEVLITNYDTRGI
ncbi:MULTISPECIES: Dam family site-specific DNA-(adenine-N6)-methyltransferase [unclassified Bacillus (in: firmicutes)]|uniref:Dam family site-specific DNA-(adenine-N6)-methyltransferase n=1 Tax=unclassified Bacillus (in: firmicutes) TaxID=185979 RepID=UPI0008E9C8E0|nr:MULTISPECIES: DNA adenine methylase [unclassified Bacillus (in: firmicutes)]SFA86477.1 DNA adenine methylase [Bacillus sp. UNCCL13]SFQ83717.1 DNA adenine methylase [Bacillus sp. cl95]